MNIKKQVRMQSNHTIRMGLIKFNPRSSRVPFARMEYEGSHDSLISSLVKIFIPRTFLAKKLEKLGTNGIKNTIYTLTNFVYQSKKNSSSIGSIVRLSWLLLFIYVPSYSSSFDQLFNQANNFHYQQQFEQAIQFYLKALELDPDHPQAHFNLGITYSYLNQPMQAIEQYQKAFELNPNYQKAQTYLIKELLQQNMIEQALQHGKKALENKITDTSLLEKLGLAYIHHDQLDMAYAMYNHILTIDPNNNGAVYNIAFLLTRLGDYEKAIEYYQKALHKNPVLAPAHLGLSKAYLATGNFVDGWSEFEWRFPNPALYHETFGYNVLKPEDLKNKCILLRAEWGFGDMTQFLRYAQLIKKAGAKKITVQTFTQLVPLFSGCDYLDQVIAIDTPLPASDLQIPLLSLPLIFKTTLETIPANIPYLYADQKLVEYWRTELADDHNLKVGLCWHSKPIFLEDHKHTRRSIPLQEFAPLTHIQGVSFYSLQKEYGMDELHKSNNTIKLHDFGPDFDETHGRFMDSAAVIKNLDIIISADTSIIHVAGALGAMVWVALPYCPEWRWLPTNPNYATTTPWYPKNMRLFRQKEPGNWHSVIQEIKQALEIIIAQKKKKG